VATGAAFGSFERTSTIPATAVVVK